MQNKGQLEGKSKLAVKAKETYDGIGNLIKWYAGKSNDKPAGGNMYRVSCQNIFIQNCWGISKMDVHQFLKHHLPAAMFKQGLDIQKLA